MITEDDFNGVTDEIKRASNTYEVAAGITTEKFTPIHPATGQEYRGEDWMFIYGLKSDKTHTMFVITKSRAGRAKWFCPSKRHVGEMIDAMRIAYLKLDDHNNQIRL